MKRIKYLYFDNRHIGYLIDTSPTNVENELISSAESRTVVLHRMLNKQSINRNLF